MNKKSRLPHHEPDTQSELSRSTQLLLRALDSLHSALGRSPGYDELEEWTGVAKRTIQDWCNNVGRPTAEFLLQLLERVPPGQRHELMDSACRVYPSLVHPRMASDHAVLSQLRTLARQSRGLVFIQGPSDENRTFLLTAMAHAFLSLTPRPHSVLGLDAHEPDWFVPVPGVRYLRNLFQPAKLLEAARDHWPEVERRGPRLVVFNAMGVGLADFARPVKALTARCNVIIAEAAPVKPAVLKRMSHGPIHILTVSKPAEPATGITVAVEAL